MKKLPLIAFWYTAFWGLFCAIIYFAVPYMPLSWTPSTAWAYHLLTFEKCLQNYQDAAGQPRVVVVGPSYPYFLGEFGGIYNLSLNAATPREVERLMEHCSPNDTILYFCAISDITVLPNLPPVRLTTTNSLLRRIFIFTDLKSHAPLEIRPGDVRAYLKQYQETPDYSFYDNLLQRFPNLIFVIQPFNYAPSQRQLEYWDAMIANYPHVDLRPVVGPNDFRDALHFNDSGIRKVQTYLANLFICV